MRTSRSEHFGNVVHFSLAGGAPNNRADNQADHLVEKSIAVEIDRQARTLPTDGNRVNRSDSVFLHLAATGGESGKIMPADESVSSGLNDRQINWSTDMPRPFVLERRQDRSRPDPVAINFSFGGKARVKTFRHALRAQNTNSRRQ